MATRGAALAAVAVMAISSVASGCRELPQLRSEETTSPETGLATPSSRPTPTSGSGIARLVIETFDDPAIFGGPGQEVLRYPVSAGDGFAILGEVSESGATHEEAWLSSDGEKWQRVRQIPAMDGAWLAGVAELPQGRLLAIGRIVGDANIWTSDDAGRTWAVGTIADVPPGTAFGQVVSGPAGVLLLGVDTSTRAEVASLFWSPDGEEWTLVAMPADVFARGQIRSIAATPSGFLALGGRLPVEPAPISDPFLGARAAAWWSTDGRTWASADVEDGPILYGAWAGSKGSLGLGMNDKLAGAPPAPWYSVDGRQWDLQNLTMESGAPAVWDSRIFMLRSKFVGSDAVVELSESGNGVEWRVAGQTPEARTGGIGVIAPGAPGLIQVGGSDGDVTVWLIRWPEG